MMGSFIDKDEIDKKLKSLSHDILKIGQALGDDELTGLGIKKITKNDNQYKITTIDDKVTIIEDFADIRYDFIDGKVRTIDNEEHKRVKEYVDTLFIILKRAKDKNLIE